MEEKPKKKKNIKIMGDTIMDNDTLGTLKIEKTNKKRLGDGASKAKMIKG